MATFIMATDESAELGGYMSEVLDRDVALKALNDRPVNVDTEYGSSPALRVHVLDAVSGDDLGIRLLYWAVPQQQLLAANGSWIVGRFVEEPQANDPSRTVYRIMPAIDATTSTAAQAIEVFESRRVFRT